MGTFSIWHILIVLLVLPFSLAFYILPGLIGVIRNHPSRVAILLVNPFLGWSGIAWLVCLIWSLVTPRGPAAQA